MKKKSKTMLYVGVGIVVVVIIVAVALMVSKKKDTSTDMTATTSSAIATNAVTLNSFAFNPGTITVKVGSTVTWTNADDVGHTVTADTASADAPNSKTIAKGGTYSFTFNKAGTYAYHCTIHSGMQGTVIVTE